MYINMHFFKDWICFNYVAYDQNFCYDLTLINISFHPLENSFSIQPKDRFSTEVKMKYNAISCLLNIDQHSYYLKPLEEHSKHAFYLYFVFTIFQDS